MTTAAELQRFVVRLLWDPALVERVYAGQPVPGLDAAGRAALTAGDKRAWGLDPYRRARTLQALIEEYPASVAECGVAGLEAFFDTSGFHDAVMARGVLAMSFGEWLAPRAGPVCRIELGFVRLRRDRPAQPGPGEIVRGGVPLEVPAGTLARWEGLLAALGPAPIPKLLAGFRVAPAIASRGKEHLVLQRAPREQVVPASDGVCALLTKAARPTPRPVIVRAASKLGAGRGADALVDELVAEGLLVAG